MPAEIQHKNRVYRFHWFGAEGWLPINKNGSRSRAQVPNCVWKTFLDYITRAQPTCGETRS